MTTRRVVVLGATGRIGRLVVERCLAADHAVVALVRDTASAVPDGVQVVGGDATDGDALRHALIDSDAVIAALGPRGNRMDEAIALETAMRTLVEAMDELGVRRLVALSGAGITVPGDEQRKPAGDRLMTAIVRRLARHVVEAKQHEFDIFSASDLDWTAVRPPLVHDGPARGYRLGERLEIGARVTRADAAAALADQVIDATYLRAAPFVLPPKG